MSGICSVHLPLGGISLYYHRLHSVIVSEWLGGCFGNQVFDSLKTVICHLIPVENCILLQHCSQCLYVMSEMWYKVGHVCHHTNETVHLLLVHGWCHFCDTLYLLGAGVHAINTVFCSEERDSWLLVFQLLTVQEKAF